MISFRGIGKHSIMTSHRFRLFVLALSVATLGAFFIAPQLHAQASSGTIAQGFTANNDKGVIVAGALVSLKADTKTVELATATSSEGLVGVVDQSSLLVISSGAKEAQVVLGGTANTLVSDINGAIKAGDHITASPIAGVGMKATSTARAVGIVQSDFDTAHSQTKTIVDSHGQQHAVHIGYVSAQISLSNYEAPGSTYLPVFVQNIANNVAGRQVSIIRVLVCSLLLVLSFLSLAIFIFSSARAAMVSIGRNPLASKDIRKSLYQVGAITIAAWGGALLACYFILTL
jgi:hypothetical protein